MAKKKSSKKKGKKTLSKEDIKHLALLVRLKLSQEEEETYQGQLVDTIDYVQNLSELETEGVKGLSHTTDAKNITFKDGTESTRTLTQEDATKNARNSEDGYFIVDKILDK